MITAMPFHSIWVAESNAHKGGYILQLITWLLHIMLISTFYVTVAWLHSKWMHLKYVDELNANPASDNMGGYGLHLEMIVKMI